jgi:DNA-binding NtrC family response regulator
LLILQAGDLPERLDERFPGAMDFLFTPLREAEVCPRARRLLAGSRAPESHRVHQRTPETVGLAQLVGEDPAFVTLKRKLPLLAQCEAPVLLTGETGTGKGLCARALHYLSRLAVHPSLGTGSTATPRGTGPRTLARASAGCHMPTGDDPGLAPAFLQSTLCSLKSAVTARRPSVDAMLALARGP